MGPQSCPLSLFRRVLQTLPLGAGGRRLQRRLGCYEPADFLVDIRSTWCQIITVERFVTALFHLDEPVTAVPLPAHCVRFVSTPAREVPEIMSAMQVGPQDEFWDIGCGLGVVSLLIGWLSGARVLGLDFHDEYCQQATRAAHSFALPHVRFLNGDARDASYLSGNKFYMFMPFSGEVERAVFARLREVAVHHAITIGWRGPSLDLRLYPWLSAEFPDDEALESTIKLRVYQSGRRLPL